MSRSQQSSAGSTWVQQLARGTAVTLPAASGVRRLRVIEGRLWLTLTSPVVSSDQWLARDDIFDLSAGQTAVVEAWPSARFEMLAPMAASRFPSVGADALHGGMSASPSANTPS